MKLIRAEVVEDTMREDPYLNYLSWNLEKDLMVISLRFKIWGILKFIYSGDPPGKRF